MWEIKEIWAVREYLGGPGLVEGEYSIIYPGGYHERLREMCILRWS